MKPPSVYVEGGEERLMLSPGDATPDLLALMGAGVAVGLGDEARISTEAVEVEVEDLEMVRALVESARWADA